MRILITGAAGMLGSSVIPELMSRGHTLAVTDIRLDQPRPWGPEGPRICHLDVRDDAEIRDAFAAVRPELVLHLAAVTSLEVCERDPDGAARTNALGTKLVALGCQRAAVPMCYISTAGVFDGAKTEPYTEFDQPNPINVYGRTKLAGEYFTQNLVDHHFVVRAGWMVGGGHGKDHKFVSLIVDQLLAGARTIHAVFDKLGTPTYAQDFARCLADLVVSGSYGLYHMSGDGTGSRFDVARLILEVLGRDDVKLVPVNSEFFGREYFAPRPRSELMRNMMLELQGMNSMRPWEQAVEDYLREAFADQFAVRDSVGIAP